MSGIEATAAQGALAPPRGLRAAMALVLVLASLALSVYAVPYFFLLVLLAANGRPGEWALPVILLGLLALTPMISVPLAWRQRRWLPRRRREALIGAIMMCPAAAFWGFWVIGGTWQHGSNLLATGMFARWIGGPAVLSGVMVVLFAGLWWLRAGRTRGTP